MSIAMMVSAIVILYKEALARTQKPVLRSGLL